MSNTSEYKDIVAFHPGYYIADVIEDMGITQAEFATRLGTNTKTLSYLLNGQANITHGTNKVDPDHQATIKKALAAG